MPQVLSAQKILSAPVVACDEADSPDDCTDVIGFIDIRDVLVSFLSGAQSVIRLDCDKEVRLGHSLALKLESAVTADVGVLKCLEGQPMLQCMHTLEEAGKAFGNKKLQDLSELGRSEPHYLTNRVDIQLYIGLGITRQGKWI